VQLDANEKFCPQCGSHNVSYDYKGEPLRIEHHKDTSWLNQKKIIIFVAIGAIAVISAIAIFASNPSKNGITTTILSPVSSLVPTRDDGIETEWKMEPIEHDYNQFVLSKFRPQGFNDAAQVYFHKNEFFSEDSSVLITIYKFDSIGRASSQYASLVAAIREEGGFTERQIDNVKTNCYSTTSLASPFSNYDINSYCTVSNVIFHLAGNSIFEDGIDKFAEAISQRVERVSVSDNLSA
jgi:hypothetical protein